MYTYEEDNNYIDEEKKSRVPFFVLLIIVIVIVFSVVLSCGMKEKDSNSNLSYLRITNATITPTFTKDKYNYTVETTSNSVRISCNKESSKAKVDGCNKEINVTEKAYKHVIKVTSEDGGFKKYTLNIVKKTTEEKKISVNIESDISSGEKTTKEQVKLVAKLSENVSVKYEWYKNGIIISNESSSELLVKDSGTYIVKVINGSDIISSNEFVVNIEKKETTSSNQNTTSTNSNTNKFVLKIDSVTGNSSSWVKQVTLKVNATSSNGIDGYSFDGGKTYQKTNTMTFKTNKNVKIVVKDKAGKTISKEVAISKVDSSVPKVTINYTDKVSKSVSLYATINPSNVPSGYNFKWYKDGKIIANVNSLTYKATEAGTYKIEVTTGSGNVASATYKFTPVAITCPTLLVTDSTGKAVKNNTWINDYIFFKITPSKETVSYDVYLNESGYFDSINKNFTYYNTFDNTVKVKMVNGGIRILKIVIKDENGNQNICYSKNYYLK